METVFFKGVECHTNGTLPDVGQMAPKFTLITPGLAEITEETYRGKRVVLNIFPSIDTEVCAMSVRRFNSEAASLPDTVVLAVSVDLPFAAGRFCSANGIKNVIPASAFREKDFEDGYGVKLIDGPLKGLLARAVIIIDRDGRIMYRELVDEITHEPDYEAALSVLRPGGGYY